MGSRLLVKLCHSTYWAPLLSYSFLSINAMVQQKSVYLSSDYSYISFSRPPLQSAILAGNSDRVRKLIKECPQCIEVCHEGMSSLHCAVISGDEDILTTIPAHGGFQQSNDNDYFGNTPLILAVKSNNSNAVKSLMMHSDLRIRNRKGKSALDYALKRKSLALINTFVEYLSLDGRKRIVRDPMIPWVIQCIEKKQKCKIMV